MLLFATAAMPFASNQALIPVSFELLGFLAFVAVASYVAAKELETICRNLRRMSLTLRSTYRAIRRHWRD